MHTLTHSLTLNIMSTQITSVVCKILESVQAHFPQCTLVTYTINYDITVCIIHTHHALKN